MSDILNPNCSEIVCRLSTDEDDKSNYMSVYTDRYPNSAMDLLLKKAKQEAERLEGTGFFPDIELIENNGGGGDWKYVESAWSIAHLYAIGKLTEWQVKDLDARLCMKKNMLTGRCQQCLDVTPEKTCGQYVKRMVGECKGADGGKKAADHLQKLLGENE